MTESHQQMRRKQLLQRVERLEDEFNTLDQEFEALNAEMQQLREKYLIAGRKRDEARERFLDATKKLLETLPSKAWEKEPHDDTTAS